VTAIRPIDMRIPEQGRLERTLSSALLAAAVALVVLVWPLAEATRFLLEKLLCPKR
jgi:hypothetical protein